MSGRARAIRLAALALAALGVAVVAGTPAYAPEAPVHAPGALREHERPSWEFL
ncbi:hypothetical protein [Rubrimonas cliftonensis]|uniref:hypothetical protein n=1 Tax=Rubrimonas cliftonensis TaxID=89524 RepID=UPI00158745D8|nr:hypothetical protein [Rubrimonas cliftonensis]